MNNTIKDRIVVTIIALSLCIIWGICSFVCSEFLENNTSIVSTIFRCVHAFVGGILVGNGAIRIGMLCANKE